MPAQGWYYTRTTSPLHPQPCDACDFKKMFNSALDCGRRRTSNYRSCRLAGPRRIARSSQEIERKSAAEELQKHRRPFVTYALVHVYMGYVRLQSAHFRFFQYSTTFYLEYIWSYSKTDTNLGFRGEVSYLSVQGRL